jgi:UPF0755 protein
MSYIAPPDQAPDDVDLYDDFDGDLDDQRHQGLSWLIGALVVVAIVGVALWISSSWIKSQFSPGGPEREVTVEIAKGSSNADIADQLGEANIIRSSGFFQAYIQFKGAKPFQAGSYTFRAPQNMVDVIRQLEAGPTVDVTRLTIPEGLTLDQIADRVAKLPGRDKQKFLDVARSGTVKSKYQPVGQTSLEGLLFPDTYFISSSEDEQALLQRMVTRFDEVLDEVGFRDASAAAGLAPYDAVIIASMIEREAKVEDERPIISGVIKNRLRDGMRLQLDATVQYALGGKAPTTADLQNNTSPYNTYKIDGLPPTPIASAGKASLVAAVNPAEHGYFFYVLSDEAGRHAFSATFAEQEANIAIARKKGLL